MSASGALKEIEPTAVDSRIHLDEAGLPVFVGEPSQAMVTLADRLSDEVTRYPDVFAGVSYAWDYSSILVFAKGSPSEAMALLGRSGSFKVDPALVSIVSVHYSTSDLDELMASLGTWAEGRESVMDYGPDLPTNTVSMKIQDLADRSDSCASLAQDLYQSLSKEPALARSQKSAGADLPITVTIASPHEQAVAEATRTNDSSITSLNSEECVRGIPQLR